MSISQQPLRVVIYARYSTDEQNPRSVEDQYAYCRTHLQQQNLSCENTEEVCDRQISGERVRRPGIDHVRDCIERQACDLVIAEDASRYYRHTTQCMSLLEEACDAGVRVIAINDHIDTANSDWKLNAFFASMRSELYNRDTAARIRRSQERLFKDGFAVGNYVAGYVREALNPGTGRGPYRDRKDDTWTPIIHRAFEMTARGEPLWAVADFLSRSGLLKTSKSTPGTWRPYNVRGLIQNPIYSGRRVWRRTTSQKRYRTGKAEQVKSPPNEVLTRELPEWAHVPRWLWQQANDAIKQRRLSPQLAEGQSRSTKGVPRDRWQPLAKHFYCGICNAQMYLSGSGYHCADCKRRTSRTTQPDQLCWNRCLPTPEIVLSKLSAAIVARLQQAVGDATVLLDAVQHIVHHGDGDTQRRVEELRRQETQLLSRCQRLTQALESGRELNSVLEALQARETELRQVRAEIERLTTQDVRQIPLPTLADVQARLAELGPQFLSTLGREAGPLLRRLTTPIRAVPYKAADATRVVLRAHFNLRLVSLLPDQWPDLLRDRLNPEQAARFAEFSEIPMVVDLFDVPLTVQHAAQIMRLRATGLTVKQAAEKLGIPFWLAKDASKAARTLAELGWDEWYQPVNSAADLPPGWPYLERDRKIRQKRAAAAQGAEALPALRVVESEPGGDGAAVADSPEESHAVDAA